MGFFLIFRYILLLNTNPNCQHKTLRARCTAKWYDGKGLFRAPVSWERLELGYGQIQPRTGERQSSVYGSEYLHNWSPVVLCGLSRLGTANSQPPVGLGPKSHFKGIGAAIC